MRAEGQARCKRRSVVLAMVASFLLLVPATALAASATYPVGPSPASLAEGDFNRDGIADLVTPNTGPFDGDESKPDSISVLIGRRDGTFAPERRYRVGAGPTDVAVGDFNEDGHQDLAVINLFEENFSILLGRGDGTFGAPRRSYPVQDRGSGPYTVAVGDIDGDGHLDVAIGTIFRGDVSVRYGRGDGSFSAEQILSAGTDQSTGVAVADLNDDGRPDIAVGTNFGIYVFLNAGGRSFLPRQQYDERPTGHITTADLNGDGHPDLVAVNPVGKSIEEDETDRTQTVTVLLGTGTGVFGPPRRYQVGRNPVHVAVDDLNGDGRQDLLVSNNDFHGADEFSPFQPLVDPDYVSILYGRGDGTFESQVKVPTGDGPVASVIADFDRDGRKDFAVALAGEDAVQVFLRGPTCAGLHATIVGTAGDNVLRGTARRDVIRARAGDDTIRARGGNDVICANEDEDSVRAGGGDDYVSGGRGDDDDRLRGGGGDDEIRAQRGDDVLRGGGGSDFLLGNRQDDLVLGGKGPDRLLGNKGDDVLRGGRGRDELVGGQGDDVTRQ